MSEQNAGCGTYEQRAALIMRNYLMNSPSNCFEKSDIKRLDNMLRSNRSVEEHHKISNLIENSFEYIVISRNVLQERHGVTDYTNLVPFKISVDISERGKLSKFAGKRLYCFFVAGDKTDNVAHMLVKVMQ